MFRGTIHIASYIPVNSSRAWTKCGLEVLLTVGYDDGPEAITGCTTLRASDCILCLTKDIEDHA